MTSPAQPSPAASTRRLVADYADAFTGWLTDTDADREQNRVWSPLGLWLLLALAGPGAAPEDRDRLEGLLGTDVDDARTRLAELLDSPHPAVKAALAAWTAPDVPRLAALAGPLPKATQTGRIPTPRKADAWASRHTDGLVPTFPVQIQPDTAVLLASALATRFAWDTPLAEVSPAELGGRFGDLAGTALHAPDAILVDTDAAGLVAAVCPDAHTGLRVWSVIADPEIAEAQVHQAAAQVAAAAAAGWTADGPARRVSLFDQPLGAGHAWTLEETTHTQASHLPTEIGSAVLPRWDAASDLDLLAAPGVAEVAASISAALPASMHPVIVEARQSATAEYTKTGFAAAAVTAISFRAGAAFMPPVETVVRELTVRFNRPHAVLAAVANFGPDVSAHYAWRGVPVFSAWVTTPS